MTTAVPLHQHWLDIYRRRFIVALTAVSAAGFAFLFSAAIPPVYEAKTTFYLAGNARPPVFSGETSPASNTPEPLFPVPEEKAASLNIGIIRGRDTMLALARSFPERDFGTLRRRIDVTVSGEFMIDVFARDTDPDLAARIANRLTELYAAFHRDSMRARSETVRAALAERLAAVEAQLAAAVARRSALRQSTGMTGNPADVARLAERRDTARRAVLAQEVVEAEASARVTALRAALEGEAGNYRPGEMVMTNPAVDSMLEQIYELQLQIAGGTDGPNSPRQSTIRAQIAKVEADMAAELGRLALSRTKPRESLFEDVRRDLVTAEADLAARAEARARLDADLATAEAALAAGLTSLTAFEAVEAEEGRLNDRIAAIRANLDEAALQAANAVPPLVIVERAVVPERPVFPLPVLNAVVGAMAGLLAGVYYALILAYLGRLRLRRIAEVVALPRFSPDEIATLRQLMANRNG